MIAKKYSKHDVSLLWLFVKKLYYAQSTTLTQTLVRRSTNLNNPNEQRGGGIIVGVGGGIVGLTNRLIQPGSMISGNQGSGVGIGGGIGIGGGVIGSGGILTTNINGNSCWIDDKNGIMVKDDDGLLLNGLSLNEHHHHHHHDGVGGGGKQLDFKHPKSGEFKHPGGSYMNTYPLSHTITDTTLSDCVFGDGELTIDNVDCVKSFRNGFLYTGPHDLCKGWSLPSSSIMNHDLQPSRPQDLQQQDNNNAVGASSSSQETTPPPNDQPMNILKIISPSIPPAWEPHQVLADCLALQTEIGDVQTSISILIVLGDRKNELPIDDVTYVSSLTSVFNLFAFF